MESPDQDQVWHTTLSCIWSYNWSEGDEEIAFVTKQEVKNYMKVHQLLGHSGRDKLLGSCNASNAVKSACDNCFIAKTRRMNFNRVCEAHN